MTGIDLADRQTLAINSIPPLSVMLEVSYTHTAKALGISIRTLRNKLADYRLMGINA